MAEVQFPGILERSRKPYHVEDPRIGEGERQIGCEPRARQRVVAACPAAADFYMSDYREARQILDRNFHDLWSGRGVKITRKK
jgi:hypothetical protein